MKGGEATESEVIREVFEAIKSKGWAMEYKSPAGAAPKAIEDTPANLGGLTMDDRKVLLGCPKGRWFYEGEVPSVTTRIGYRLKRLCKAGLVEKGKDKSYRVKEGL